MPEPSRQELIEAFSGLRMFVDKQGRRAPHKPLLALIALARVQQGKPRWIRFSEVEALLAALLEEYAPPTKRVKPHYPFWFMRSDRLWEVENADSFEICGDDAPRVGDLRDRGRGGLTEEIFSALSADPDCTQLLIRMILETHFPVGIHDEVAEEAEADLRNPHRLVTREVTSRYRDPRFRKNVLRAYGNECAICGFQARFKRSTFGIDAAHIRMHSQDGPDKVSNGIALCALHHRAFDRGVLGIEDDLTVTLSPHLDHDPSRDQWFEPFRGMAIHCPQDSESEPAREYLDWHRRLVFRA